jgi:hypothetical protein
VLVLQRCDDCVGYGLFDDDLWMYGMAAPVHHGVESVVVVGGVFNGADSAVGFVEAVGALDNISVTLLVLALDVTGVVVLDSVFELILGVGLEK